MERDPETPRARFLAPLVVLVSAVFSFLVLVLPARGLTFVRDDWGHLYQLSHTSWPARWLGMSMEHWVPILEALIDVKRLTFGTNHTAYVVTNWAVHVLNVYLLLVLLRRRVQDERAAALAATAFGLVTVYREVIWWAVLAGLGVCFTITLAGFLALERYRSGGTRWLYAAALAAFAAPLAFGSGLALGPALALEAWFLAPREKRVRATATIAAGFLAYVAIYVPLAAANAPRLTPRDATELGLAAHFAVELLGSGMVAPFFFSGGGPTSPLGVSLAVAYVALVAVGLYALAPEQRLRLALAQVYLVLLLVPIALTRWSFTSYNATASRYQYLPSIVWTTGIALGLAAAFRRAPRLTLGTSLVGCLCLGAGHALVARNDRLDYSPAARARHPELLAHLETAVRKAREPVYDAPLAPIANPSERAFVILSITAPGIRATFTNARTPATIAPYLADPVLVPFVR